MSGPATRHFTALLTGVFASKGIVVRPWSALPRRSRSVLMVQTADKPTILYVKESSIEPAFWGLTRNQIRRIEESGNRWFVILLKRNGEEGYLLTGNQVNARTRRGDLTLSGDGDFKLNEGADVVSAQYFARFGDLLARAF